MHPAQFIYIYCSPKDTSELGRTLPTSSELKAVNLTINSIPNDGLGPKPVFSRTTCERGIAIAAEVLVKKEGNWKEILNQQIMEAEDLSSLKSCTKMPQN